MSAVRKNNAISLRFQLISIVITSILLGYIAYNFMLKFCTADKSPPISPLTPSIIEEFTSKPKSVRMGLTVNDFSEFNTRENKFTFSGLIWFYYDPNVFPKDLIEQFSFNKGEILEKKIAYNYLIGEKLMTGYNISVKFRTDLYYGYFPFEDHRIYIVLDNLAVSTKEMIFRISQSDFIVEQKYISGWYYSNHDVQEGYYVTQLGTLGKTKETQHPRIIFQIDYLHYSVRFILMVFLPLLLVFYLGLFSFCLDREKYYGVLVASSQANIAGLFAYRFVLENIAPKVAYLTISDYIFFLFLISSFIVFIIHVSPYFSVFKKKIISIGLQLMVIGTFFYLFTSWASC